MLQYSAVFIITITYSVLCMTKTCSFEGDSAIGRVFVYVFNPWRGCSVLHDSVLPGMHQTERTQGENFMKLVCCVSIHIALKTEPQCCRSHMLPTQFLALLPQLMV